MKYCKNCKVKVDADRNYCPLCFRELEVKDDQTVGEYPFVERKKNETFTKNNSFVFKFFIFLSVCAVTICLLVNFLVNPDFKWSLVVVSGIFYVWILVSHTIISRRGVFEKILMQLLGIFLILWACEQISYERHWLANYVAPSISMCSILTMVLISFIRKDKTWVLAFFFIIILLTVVSVIFFRFATFKILGIINLVFCGLTLFGYLTFGYGVIKTEFSKKFHI